MSAFRKSLSLLSPAKGSSSLSDLSPSGSRRVSTSPVKILTAHLDPASLPSVINPNNAKKSKTLYSHLIDLPHNGVGTRVRQVRWAARGIDVPFKKEFTGPILDPEQRKQEGHLCYWEVTKARLRRTGESDTPHGKVWGRLVWRGAPITPAGKEKRIRGGLKYSWDAAK